MSFEAGFLIGFGIAAILALLVFRIYQNRMPLPDNDQLEAAVQKAEGLVGRLQTATGRINTATQAAQGIEPEGETDGST